MGRKGRVNKNNAAAGKTVEQDVPKEEPVPEPPKEPEMSLGEKKLLKQREKEQREEQERLKREAQAAQLLKQESKAHAKKNKSKSQKIKLDRNFSESSQQSSPEKVVQSKERKVPGEQISLKEEIQVKQEPEPIQSSQNVYRNEPSIDSDFAGNATMKNESDDWADEIDEHCKQFNAGPTKTDSVAFFSDNRYQNRDNQGSDQWQNTTYYTRSRQPNRDGSTSNFQQERSGYRGTNRNPRRGTDYHNDNINSRERGNDHRGSNYQQGRGSRNSRGGTDYHTDTRTPRGGTEYHTDNSNSRERGNNHRGSNYKKTRGFSNSFSSSDRGGNNRGNQQRYSQHWNSQPQHYDKKPPKTNYGDSNNSEQDNWGDTLKVDEWQAEPQNTENQQSVPAATQDTFTYASSAQDNYDGQPNYYTQPDNSGYMGTQSYQTPEETENLNCINPPSQYTGDYNTASSDYQIQNDHDSSWDIQPTPDQSLLNTSAGAQDLKLDFPELPQSQAKPYFNQSNDQKVTSRNQSNEPSWRDSNRTPKSSYNNHRDRNQSYEQDAGNYSADKKRKNESFNSSADSSFRSGHNNSYNKRDSYSRFSDREDRSRNYGNKYCPAERKDIEFCKFNNLRRQDGPINNGKLREETGDLFDAPVEYSLAHCVAEDMSMGAGIAKTFRMKFGRVAQLLDQDARTGGLAVLEDKERFVYYLVTKERSQGKPTMYTMWLSLNKLRDHCEEHGVKKLAIPQIGCGLDRLYWSDVKQLLEYVFRDVEIEIVVYTLEGDVEDRKVKKCFINHQKLSLKDIDAGTGHIYFGYCDGTVTDDITSLSTKFNILTAYKSNRKEICEVIRTEGNTKNDDVVYGVIIKQTPNEKLNFTKLDRALRNLSKFVKKDEYNYVGFQAFVDDKDEQIIDKITTIMQYALKDVEIWVCWPKEIEAHCPPQPNRD